MKWSMTEPKAGDIIRCPIGHNIHHYAIYISDDEVIGFGLPEDAFGNPKDVCVVSSSIKEFLGKGFIEVREYSLLEKMKKRSAKDIITKARSRLGEVGYSITDNNCEHFVNECVFNKHISDEVVKYNK